MGPLLMYFQKQLLLYFPPPYFMAKTKSKNTQIVSDHLGHNFHIFFLMPPLCHRRQIIFPVLCQITYSHSYLFLLIYQIFPALWQITSIPTHLFPLLSCQITSIYPHSSFFVNYFLFFCQITSIYISTHLQFVNVNVSSLACDFPQR